MSIDGAVQRPLRDLVAAEVRAWLARRRLTGEALAAAMGTSPNSVSRRLRGKTSFDVDELDQVARFLGIALEELLAPALAERDRQTAAADVSKVGNGSREMHISLLPLVSATSSATSGPVGIAA